MNRKDSKQEAARLLYWSCHNKPRTHVNELLPVDQPDSFTKPGGEPSITPLFGAQGRYFTIYLPLNLALHFTELYLLRLNDF